MVYCLMYVIYIYMCFVYSGPGRARIGREAATSPATTNSVLKVNHHA
jgi:hypothetical protein